MALVYAACGRKDRTFELLEHLLNECREGTSKWAFNAALPDQRFDNLRDDPRYEKLLHLMRLENWPRGRSARAPSHGGESGA